MKRNAIPEIWQTIDESDPHIPIDMIGERKEFREGCEVFTREERLGENNCCVPRTHRKRSGDLTIARTQGPGNRNVNAQSCVYWAIQLKRGYSGCNLVSLNWGSRSVLRLVVWNQSTWPYTKKKKKPTSYVITNHQIIYFTPLGLMIKGNFKLNPLNDKQGWFTTRRSYFVLTVSWQCVTVPCEMLLRMRKDCRKGEAGIWKEVGGKSKIACSHPRKVWFAAFAVVIHPRDWIEVTLGVNNAPWSQSTAILFKNSCFACKTPSHRKLVIVWIQSSESLSFPAFNESHWLKKGLLWKFVNLEPLKTWNLFSWQWI